jgi:asparagine synthase (glutamine-hydrolysing)
MHTFAITIGVTGAHLEQIVEEVASCGKEFWLEPSTVWREQSRSGHVLAAGIHHDPSVTTNRRYMARSGQTLLAFDGLPIAADGSFPGWDAAELANHWDLLPSLLEGEFCAMRIDLDRDFVEVLLDPLGLVPVYVGRYEGGLVASTSASIVANLLSTEDFDELAVSSFIALGWAVERRTLLREVKALDGGSLHALGPREITSSRHFGPAVIAKRSKSKHSAEALTQELTDLVVQASSVGAPIRCALTAGRDTRVMAALLQHSEVPTTYYTGGEEHSIDIVIARELAARFGLEHEVRTPVTSHQDWTNAASRFIAQNDGLSSLIQLVDYIELDKPIQALDLTFWGVGGEIGRAGTGSLSNVSPNLPLLSRLPSVQRRLLALKIDDQGLLTPEGRHAVRDYLERFSNERKAEGWRTRELSEAFYTFERVANWGATGPRRASGNGDLFSPFCTRPFIEYCFSLTPQERYLEAPHYRLLSMLSPDLLDHRFEKAFQAQHRRLVGLTATRKFIDTVLSRRRHGGHAGASQEPTYLQRWLRANIGLLTSLVEAADISLWQWIDKPRLLSLLASEGEAQSAYTDTILRTATVLWFLYGR